MCYDVVMKKDSIILAADHAGFDLKESVKAFLEEKGYSVIDVGAHKLVEGDDYPTYMADAALKVARDIEGKTKAIIFGGSGQGEAIVANRFPGVRAVVWYGGNKDIVKLSREHNDANILSIGARFVNKDESIAAVDLWLNTTFSNEERHQRRNEQIDSIE